MMGCSVLGGTEHEITKDGVPVGLLSGHAYSILDVIEIEECMMEFETEEGDFEKRAECVRLLRLRNPWGKFLVYFRAISHVI